MYEFKVEATVQTVLYCYQLYGGSIVIMIQNIVVAGGGNFGSQVAFQAAYKGFNVTIWLRSTNFFDETRSKLEVLKKTYVDTITLMASPEGKTAANWAVGISEFEKFDEAECFSRVEQGSAAIRLETDLKKAVADADLVIEAVPENYDTKCTFFEMLAPLLPEKTIVVTSSSTFLPSKFLKSVKRADKFMALHFSSLLMKNNIAEMMAHDGTASQTYSAILEFTRALGMVPLPVRKENKGFLLDAMLIPLLFSALDIYARGVSDIQSIDTAWSIGTKSSKGPFEMIDAIGLNTLYDIATAYSKQPRFLAAYDYKKIASILRTYIENGKLGKVTGEGFYKYQ